MPRSRDLRLVVFLRGVNVGGHRRFRPSQLAAQLKHLGCVNIGAAGTFVFRKMPLAKLRAELKRRLPFDAHVAVCHGENIRQLIAGEADPELPPGVVRFVSIVPNKTHRLRVPLQLPARGKWLVRILRQEGRFVVGEYRRDMKTIGYLGKLDGMIGAPVTTRNWNTIKAVAKTLA